jgi:AraC-like DNA-binding protein
MSRALRQALHGKIAALPEWKCFQADFQAVTGLRVDLVDELGRVQGCVASGNSHLCEHMLGDPSGHRTCQRFRQRLLTGMEDAGREEECDAGLRETALPLRLGGLHVGYLIVAGYRVGELQKGELARSRHLLRKAGVVISRGDLDELLAKSVAFPARVWQAYSHWLEMAAREIATHLNLHVAAPAAELPEAVEKAIRLLRSHACHEEISLPWLARKCGVCAGHLSRLFVRSTGLSFTEFVARLRIEHAVDLLQHSKKTVTEIAFESGFSSLSQFHRVFRRIQGCSPRELRRNHSIHFSQSLTPSVTL